jgi:hypothetical protein
MFDSDDEVEYIDWSTQTIVNGSDDIQQRLGRVEIVAIKQGRNSAEAQVWIQTEELPMLTTVALPGNTVEYDQWLASLPTDRREPVAQIDTVHHYTHSTDTVYVSETVYVDGNVDTVRIENTITERIHTSDTVYMVPGQYLEDTKIVLNTDEEFLQTLNAYPNPAVDQITVSTRSRESSVLRIYDMTGSVVAETRIGVGFNDTTINVSDFRPGMYIYMLLDQSFSQRSATKKFIKH